MFIDEEIDFIKSQIDHHKRSVEFFHSKRDLTKANRHSGILRRFEDILPKMIECNLLNDGQPARSETPPDVSKVGSRLGNLSDLPEELRSQLVSVQRDELEQAITDVVMDVYSGIATIDEIMVGLYRRTGEIHKRDALATKIYRMTKKELLISVPQKKGVYALPETIDAVVSEEGNESSGPDKESAA